MKMVMGVGTKRNFQMWDCRKSAAWEDGFSDGVGGLLVLRWIGCVLHLAIEDS